MLTLLLTSMFFLTFHFHPVKSEPTTITVPDDYETIQWAIGNSSDGNTIFVRADIYYENLTIDKSISLIGENRDTTVVDGKGIGSTIHITADYVTISGLKIRNSKSNVRYAGVMVDGGDYINIIGNTVVDNFDGVFLTDSSNNTVCNNLLVNNSWNDIRLRMSSSSYNRISGNNISNGRRGISLEFNCNYNEISKNKMANMGICIHLGNTKRNIVRENSMTDSHTGIYLINNSSLSNVFYNNSFINNKCSVNCYADYDVWDNGYPSGGNFWSDYSGIDLLSGPHQNEIGSDGVGDTPYIIDENNRDRYPLMSPWVVPAKHMSMQWWVLTIVISGIGVSAEILYFLKKEKNIVKEHNPVCVGLKFKPTNPSYHESHKLMLCFGDTA